MSYFTKPDYTKLTEEQQEFIDMIHNAFEYAREKGLAKDYIGISMFFNHNTLMVSNEYYDEDQDNQLRYFYEEAEDTDEV